MDRQQDEEWSVVDLRSLILGRLEEPESVENLDSSHIIYLKPEKNKFAVLVERVEELIVVSEEILPLPDVVKNESNQYLKGILYREGSCLYRLDVGELYEKARCV